MALKRPHHAYPPRLNAAGTGFELVEERSDEEVIGRVEATLRCPRGFVESRETFGSPDVAQSIKDPVDVLEEVIRMQQPDAQSVLTRRPDTSSQLAAVVIEVRTVARNV